MGAPLYSEQFIRTTAGAAWQSYRVPPGFRAVVRSVTVTNTTGAAMIAYVAIANIYILTAQPGSRETLSFEMRHVAYQGMEILGYLEAGGAGLNVSGYLFEDSSGAVGPRGGVTRDAQPPLGWYEDDVLPAP